MIIINVDGLDGSGKSTLVNNLIKYYRNKNKIIDYIHFPRYETELGKVILKVLNKEIKMHPSAFQMLCSSDRLNWSTYNYPEISKTHDILIVDRFTSSGIVYGQSDGLDSDEIIYNDRRIINPDINIILIAEVETLLKRMSNRIEAKSIYENGIMLSKARKQFLDLENTIPNVQYINAEQTPSKVAKDCAKLINKLLKNKN